MSMDVDGDRMTIVVDGVELHPYRTECGEQIAWCWAMSEDDAIQVLAELEFGSREAMERELDKDDIPWAKEVSRQTLSKLTFTGDGGCEAPIPMDQAMDQHPFRCVVVSNLY